MAPLPPVETAAVLSHDVVMADKRKPSVLLVDDEGDILFSLKALLRREFELFTADSGDEALRILAQHPIQVVMTDQRMPGMTGVDLLTQVQKLYPEAVRILFTGYADIKAVVEGVNRGGLYRYLTKPWDPDDLIDVLHAAADAYERRLEQQRLMQEMRELLTEATAPSLPNGAEWQSRARLLMERLDHLLERDLASSTGADG